MEDGAQYYRNFESALKFTKYGKIKCRVLENNGSRIESLGRLEIDVEKYVQKMRAAEYISFEEERVHSGTFSSSQSKTTETDFSVSVPRISAKDLLIRAKEEIRIEGEIEAERIGIATKLFEGRSGAFYRSREHHSGKTGIFSHGSYDYRGRIAAIVPTLIKINGELVTEISSRYIEEGVIKSVNKWKGQIEEMDIGPLEIHERIEESVHSGGFSFGIPHKIRIPGEGFRRVLNSRGSQSAVYLTQGIQQLYGAMNTISKFGIGRGIPATLGIGTIGYYESDMHTVTHHDYTFDSEIQAKEYIDLEVGKGRLSGKMKAGRSIRIKSNHPLELISGYDETRRETEHESVGISANVLSLTGGISYQEGYHNSRERGVRRAVLEAAEIDIPEIRYDGMRELHESTGHTFGCGFEIGEKHPSISISYGKEKNGDGVSFGINLDVSSKEAFMKSAQEAIKGGVSAAVIGQIAQEAGLGDFWSSISGTIASMVVSDTDSGMESRGNITITHDGHTTSSEIISINFNQLRQDFDEFLDKVSPREVNYETDQIPENIEGNIKRFLLESGANSEEVEELMTEELLGIIRTRSELNLEIQVKLKGQKYFSDSLKDCAKLFVDVACYIDEFAGENPRLTNFALQATNYVLGGPVRYVMGIAAERIGITEKLDEFETKIDWTKLELIKRYSLEEQVADICVLGISSFCR